MTYQTTAVVLRSASRGSAKTSAVDAAPCQRDRRTLSELRMARMPTAPSPGAAFFSDGAR